VLYNFCAGGPPCPDGANPYAGLTYQGQQTGALYDGAAPLFGPTVFGGEGYFGQGVIYRIVPGGKKSSYKVLYTFCPQGNCLATGAMPYGRLTIDDSGRLYGTTQTYGPNGGGGTVFRVESHKGTWNLTTLYSFCHLASCADGYAPMSEVVRDASGNLFGTTLSGGVNGTNGYGVIFKLAKDGTYTVLHALNGTTDGAEPYAGLALDESGNLFGVNSAGGDPATQAGTAFELKHGRNFVVLHTFCANGCNDGAIPMATPLLDSVGGLLGTANAGGAHATGGTVFRLTP
jgi:uncharacterized repeat protein (TIGR03803 family)